MKDDMKEFGQRGLHGFHEFHGAGHRSWHGAGHQWRGRRGPGRGNGPGGPGWGAWGGWRGPWGPGNTEQWGGPGGHHRDRMERGLLRYVILNVLSDGPKHGYEIIKTLEERTGGRYAPSPGTLYPTLQYLEDLGLVTSDQEEARRVYKLTDAGRTELDQHTREIEGFWSRFSDRGRTPKGPARQ